MVCKEDVVSWFKSLKGHSRIDVMCNLFNLCLPFELRFLGTCLEDLGKRDFQELRTTETGANNPSELSSPDLQCISDKRARTKLALYISLLHSCNYACSNGYYKILANVEEVNNLIKCNGVSSAEDEVLEELLLIYTLALNHPAFTFEQKQFLGDVFIKLQQEEERRHCAKRTSLRTMQGPTGMEAVDKISVQNYVPCASPDQHPLHPPVNAGHCTPMTPAALTGDPLVSMADPHMGYIPYALMAGYHSMVLPPPPPEQRSPLVSRTNSPCQSNSPSRAGSPGRPKTGLPTSFNRPPPVVDPPRDTTVTKEAPPPSQYIPNTGKFASMEQLRRLTDDQLREELGFNSQSITQFRTLEKMQSTCTNGYNLVHKKPPPVEAEQHNDIGGGPLRRYNSVDGPLNPPPNPFCYPCMTSPSCYTCVVGYRGPNTKSLPPTLLAHHMKCMSLEHTDTGSTHNSSASDSASDHSPPDTPSLSTTSADRGLPPGPIEMWEPEQRIPEAADDRRLAGGLGRVRGVGRSNRSHPPGIQTLPRGRGHNPPHRRRDTNSSNGTIDDRTKVFATSNDTGGGGVAFPYGATPFLPPNQFLHAYPSFTSQGVFRLPFHPPNGDMIYQPLPPPQGQPFISARPTHLPFSPLVPPPKISCYNCGSQSHIGTDCPDPTIEEITNKGQYRIDYSNNVAYQKPGECSTVQDK